MCNPREDGGGRDQITDLVRGARKGDAEAFSVLIRRYERVALSVALAIAGDSATAGDVVQDAFVRAWERLHELREPARFAAWLCGIVRHLAIDVCRRRRAAEPLSESHRAADRQRWVRDPAGEAWQREREAAVASAVASLQDALRVVVLMRYYAGLPSREIGRCLDISPDAVDMRLSRAREKLRPLLQDLVSEAVA